MTSDNNACHHRVERFKKTLLKTRYLPNGRNNRRGGVSELGGPKKTTNGIIRKRARDATAVRVPRYEAARARTPATNIVGPGTVHNVRVHARYTLLAIAGRGRAHRRFSRTRRVSPVQFSGRPLRGVRDQRARSAQNAVRRTVLHARPHAQSYRAHPLDERRCTPEHYRRRRSDRFSTIDIVPANEKRLRQTTVVYRPPVARDTMSTERRNSP